MRTSTVPLREIMKQVSVNGSLSRVKRHSHCFTKLKIYNYLLYASLNWSCWLSEHKEYFSKLTGVCVAAGGDFPPSSESRIKATAAIW